MALYIISNPSGKKGSYPEFHKILFEFFADILEDDYFMKQLAKSLDIRPYHLQGS